MGHADPTGDAPRASGHPDPGREPIGRPTDKYDYVPIRITRQQHRRMRELMAEYRRDVGRTPTFSAVLDMLLADHAQLTMGGQR